MPCTREIEVAPDKVVEVAEAEDLDNDAAAVVWDCGLVMAHYLVWAAEGGQVKLAGARVLELGAGTGLVGLTAAALGAGQVVLTDRPQVVPHLQGNIQGNGLSATTTAQTLLWGEPLPHFAQSTQPGQPPFDLILASDCVYEEASVTGLVTTLSHLLSPGDSVTKCVAGATGVSRKGSDTSKEALGVSADAQDIQQQQDRDQVQVSAAAASRDGENQQQQQQQEEEQAVGAATNTSSSTDIEQPHSSHHPHPEQEAVASTATITAPMSSSSSRAPPYALVACEMREGRHLPMFHELLHKAGLQEALVPYQDLHPDWSSPDILVWRVAPRGSAP